MEKDQIKFSFLKVKEDILILGKEILNIKNEIDELKHLIFSLSDELSSIKLNLSYKLSDRQIISTESSNPTDNSTVPKEIEGLKNQIINFSIGNEGVPTDRQTYQQITTQTQKNNFLSSINSNSIENNIKKASEILDSLDKIKKEIRYKFKKITSQEMAVFSSIYQLEEINPEKVTYRQIALNLGLSESSIRDYVQKMLSKDIPIKKQKINNKIIILSISPELKKVASLATIINLRDL